MNMYANFRLLLLSAVILIATAGVSVAAEKATSGEPQTAAVPGQPQLPFALPAMPEGEPGLIPPGAATGITSPQANPNGPGTVAPTPLSNPPTSAADEDIRDIRGPIRIPAPLRWLWTVATALVVLGAFAAGWIYLKRRRSVRAKPAYEIAFEQLERARALMRPDQAREFSIQVSEAVRTYLDKRFDVGATHCTTEEFLTRLVRDTRSPLRKFTGPLRDFLGHCDLAKYAGFALAVPQMEAMHASAWRLVDETRPRPEENEKTKAAEKEQHSAVTDNVPALAAGGAS